MVNMFKKETDSHKQCWYRDGGRGGGGWVAPGVVLCTYECSDSQQYEDPSLGSGRLIRTLGWIYFAAIATEIFQLVFQAGPGPHLVLVCLLLSTD